MRAAVLAALHLTRGRTGLELYGSLAAMIGLGAAVYVASHFGLWFMSGCPETLEAQPWRPRAAYFPGNGWLT